MQVESVMSTDIMVGWLALYGDGVELGHVVRRRTDAHGSGETLRTAPTALAKQESFMCAKEEMPTPLFLNCSASTIYEQILA